MDIQEILQRDVSDTLGLADMSEIEKRVFLDEVGTLVIESAVLKFMLTLTEEAQRAFESWIETHVDSEHFLTEIAAEYPDFERVVLEEIAAYKAEVVATMKEI